MKIILGMFSSFAKTGLRHVFMCGTAVFLLAGPSWAQDGGPVLPGDESADLQSLLSEEEPLNAAMGLDFDAQGEGDIKFEQSAEDIEMQVRREAFDAALQGLLPLRPGEIRKLLEHFDRTQESVSVPVYPNPKPKFAVETIPLDPGAQPIAIKAAFGNVTTLNVVDITGAPWPIQDITWAGDFEVVEGTEQGAHIVRITPQSEFAYGNISIRLLNLKTPVILTLETSRDVVHYRFDAIIPEYGPFAEAPLIDGGIKTTAGDVNMSGILEGVIPMKAIKLDVSGIDGRTSAYRLSGQVYVRTPLTLLSPGWSSSVASADGMRVYAINDTPVLLLSDKGKMVRAHLSERSDIFEDQ